MPIPTTCPHCQTVYALADHLGGQKVRCKKCKEVIAVKKTPRRESEEVQESASGARSSAPRERLPEGPEKDRRRKAAERKSARPRPRVRSKRGLVIGLLAGGLVLLLVGGGILVALLFTSKSGSNASDLFVSVSGPWPEPMPFPMMAGNIPQDTVVTIRVANAGDPYTQEEVGDKLRALADGGHGAASTGSSKGDRMTILLSNVKDPQAFADKIDFGTVRSVNGRTITMVARKVDGPAPNADAVTVALYRLNSRKSHRRGEGARNLKNVQPDQRREEVAKALESALSDPDRGTRDEVCQALAVWGTTESVPLLLKAMEQEETRPSAIRALRQFKDPRTIEPIAACLDNFFTQGDAADALKAIGPPAEETVIKYLGHQNPRVREQACHILKVIGSQRCLPALEGLLTDKDASVAGTAQNTIRDLSARR